MTGNKNAVKIITISAISGGGRKGYMIMIENVKPSSDFVVDGCLTLKEIVDRVMELIK